MASADPLTRRRSLPPGMVPASVGATDATPLRICHWPGAAGGGSILAVGGRGDFIEKYAESYWDWRDQGFAVAAFDWRGQGRSGRLGDTPDKGHSLGFAPLVRDFAAISAWFRVTMPPPHFVVAHSMGGHLTLRHLTAGGRDFDRAVLLAPMLGITARPLGPSLTRLMARVQGWLGRGGEFSPGGGPYKPRPAGAARQLMLTGDSERYLDEPWWIANTPGVGVGSVTNGWLAAAFASLDWLAAPGRLETVATPLLILIPEHENLVDNPATRRAAARIPGAILEEIPEAAHELLRETDATRTAVLARIAAFLRG